MRGIIHVPSSLGGVRPNAHDPAAMVVRKVSFLRMEVARKKGEAERAEKELIVAEKELREMRKHCSSCGKCSACV
jgi:hypothetical protein